MLLELGFTVAFAQEDPCAGAAPEDQCELRYAHRALPPPGTVLILPQSDLSPVYEDLYDDAPMVDIAPALPAAALHPRQVADCALTSADVTEVRQELQTIRRRQGASIGVAAQGPGCQGVLDEALRTGPFLGVYRADIPSDGDAACVAVLRAAPDGWAIDPTGSCRSEVASGAGDMTPQAMQSPESTRVISVAAWLPYGGTIRFNQDLGDGIAAQVDLAWHPPKLWDVGYNSRFLGPDSKNTSSFRWLFGLEAGDGGLSGGFVGARAGFEAATPVGGFQPNEGILMGVLGHRWIGPQRAVFELAGGFQGSIPIGPQAGRRAVVVTPAIDLRVGGATRD